MTTTTFLSVEEAGTLIGGRPGLVLGQGISTQTPQVDITRDLIAIAVRIFGEDALDGRLDSANFAALLDELASSDPSQYEQFHIEAARYLQALTDRL